MSRRETFVIVRCSGLSMASPFPCLSFCGPGCPIRDNAFNWEDKLANKHSGAARRPPPFPWRSKPCDAVGDLVVAAGGEDLQLWSVTLFAKSPP
jgi:hypothetical protein